MCEPLSIAAVAIQGASIIANEAAKSKQQKANRASALQNLSLQYDDLNARAIQEQMAASQEQQAIVADAGELQSRATVGAAEGNVSGASVTAVLQDIARQRSNATETVALNLENTLDQVQRSKRGAQADAIDRINGVQGGSFLRASLGIGSAALGAISDHRAAGLRG